MSAQPTIDAERAAFEKMLETARQLVDCANEFYPEHPGALEEYVAAHVDAMDAWGEAVDALGAAILAIEAPSLDQRPGPDRVSAP